MSQIAANGAYYVHIALQSRERARAHKHRTFCRAKTYEHVREITIRCYKHTTHQKKLVTQSNRSFWNALKFNIEPDSLTKFPIASNEMLTKCPAVYDSEWDTLIRKKKRK